MCAGSSATMESTHSYADASTSYGVNRAKIFSDGGTIENPYDQGRAVSYWGDMITIIGGTGTGQVTFGEHVHGTLGPNTFGGIDMGIDYLGFGIDPEVGVGGQVYQWNNPVVYDQQIGFNYTFTYGTPFLLWGKIDLMNVNNWNSAFNADFSNTAILDTVILPDGATLISQSGTTYPVQLNAVPEPEPYGMMLAGIGLMGFIIRRRRNEQT